MSYVQFFRGVSPTFSTMNQPNNRGWEEIRVSIALTVLATIAVVLRFAAKLRRGIHLELDDYFALIGLVQFTYIDLKSSANV